MQIRDRIIAFRRVPAAELRPNPRNWRVHPDAQRDALRGVLAEIGYAGALLARELCDGSLELIDGHLRAETTPDMPVPVLVLDLDERESDKLLALHDPLAAMAEADTTALGQLLSDVETQNESVQALLDDLAQQHAPAENALAEQPDRPEVTIPERWQLVVQCQDEADQRALYEELTQREYACRVLTL